MPIIKTADLIGPALTYAVAMCEGYSNLRTGVFSGVLVMDPPRKEFGAVEFSSLCYSTDWSQGGPIIERERIQIAPLPGPGWRGHWRSFNNADRREVWMDCFNEGITALVAAMRCFVASRLGDTVEIPEELL